MKVILCGYHWTGCKALGCLLRRGHEVYVYTHPAQNAVCVLEGLCIKTGTPYTFDKIIKGNMPFVPDVICSIYYRYIISGEVIETVKGKIFNLHPALLPKYRGCSSLTWAMINGEDECGFSFRYIDVGCDTGNIIIQKTIKIEDFDTQLTLYHKVMFEAMNYFDEAFDLVVNGFDGYPQKGENSYYRRGCPLDGIITDEMDQEMQERMVRAMIYPPYKSAVYKNQNVETLSKLISVRENNICDS